MYLKICISGLTATGKTTMGSAIAKRYGAEYISASAELPRRAGEKGLIEPSKGEEHFWLRGPGHSLFSLREADLKFDRDLDKTMLSHMTTRRDTVIDSLTAPFLMPKVNNAFSILLKASFYQRVVFILS